MSRFKRFIETDVLTESLSRIRSMYDRFDNVVVSFSGGKDSQVVLELCRQVAIEERGLERVNVVFHDEEFIPDAVLDHVDYYRRLPWVNLVWMAVPLESEMYVLGQVQRYVQWDTSGREWLRPKPEWSVDPSGGRVLDQWSVNEMTADVFGYPGSYVFLLGLRAQEALIRYRSVTTRLVDNYVHLASKGRCSTASPIYDWDENDVWRLFYERAVPYCAFYDDAVWSGTKSLRISTLLHAGSAKVVDTYRPAAPALYERAVDIFPDFATQARYFHEWKGAVAPAENAAPVTPQAIRRWVLDNITEPVQRGLALRRFAAAERLMKRMPENYPPEYVLNYFMSGGYKKALPPKYVPRPVVPEASA